MIEKLTRTGVPTAREGYYETGLIVYYKTGMSDEAAHYNLGIAYSRKRMYDDAILEYKKVIEPNPNLPDVHYNSGVVYRGKGMHLQAKREVSLYKKLNS